MNSTRRELLKYFGIGTVIAPIAGASPLAKLIEVPKVELLEATHIPKPLDMGRIVSCSIALVDQDGTARTVQAKVRGNGIVKPGDEISVYITARHENGASPVAWLASAQVNGSTLL